MKRKTMWETYVSHAVPSGWCSCAVCLEVHTALQRAVAQAAAEGAGWLDAEAARCAVARRYNRPARTAILGLPGVVQCTTQNEIKKAAAKAQAQKNKARLDALLKK